MPMQFDVSAAYTAATGTVVSGRVRIKAVAIAAGASAGSVVLRDGGASGVTKLQIDSPANAGVTTVLVPGEGILCATDVHATLTNCTLTTFYG